MLQSKVNKPEAIAMYEAGATLRVVGERYGVTRERIRQIVTAAGKSLGFRIKSKPRYCPVCGTLLSFNKRYCSRECKIEARKIAFWLNVDQSHGPDSCWLWQGNKHPVTGYGNFSFMCKKYYAHRLAWEFANNKGIPAELFVMHKCDNPSCCNPKHLSLGTPQDNTQDAVNKGRMGTGVIKLTPEQVREIRQDKRTEIEIAKDYNICPQYVYMIKKNKARNKKPRLRLTWAQVLAIRADKRKDRIIAEEYGIVANTVWMIQSGRTRKFK